MRKSPLFIACALAATISSPVWAGRDVTDEERVKLVAAMAAEGCSGGKMEFDDDKYEVDDAQCKDGRRYDLDFDTAFKLVKKKAED